MNKNLVKLLSLLIIVFSTLLLIMNVLNYDLSVFFDFLNLRFIFSFYIILTLITLYIMFNSPRDLNDKEKGIINQFYSNQKRIKMLISLLQNSKDNDYRDLITTERFKGSRIEEILVFINSIIKLFKKEKENNEKIKNTLIKSFKEIIEQTNDLNDYIKNNELNYNVNFIKEIVEGIKKQEVEYDTLAAKVVNLQLNNQDKLLIQDISNILILSDKIVTDLEVLKRKIEFSEENIINLKNINEKQNGIIKQMEKVVQSDLSIWSRNNKKI